MPGFQVDSKSFGVGGEGKKTHVTGATCERQKGKLLGWPGGVPTGKVLKFGPLRVQFQHSGAKISV